VRRVPIRGGVTRVRLVGYPRPWYPVFQGALNNRPHGCGGYMDMLMAVQEGDTNACSRQPSGRGPRFGLDLPLKPRIILATKDFMGRPFSEKRLLLSDKVRETAGEGSALREVEVNTDRDMFLVKFFYAVQDGVRVPSIHKDTYARHPPRLDGFENAPVAG